MNGAEEALAAWEAACAQAHDGAATGRPLLTTARLIIAGDRLKDALGALARPRLYGLTAEEWLHLAAEGDDSEVAPCCANVSAVRELLNQLATLQAGDDAGWQLAVGRRLLEVVEADGDGHGLSDREAFPLLHRVLDGVRAQQAACPRKGAQE